MWAWETLSALPIAVIAVAGLVFKSAKTPNEAIASFANAPELLRGLGKGLGILQNVQSSKP